MLKTNQDILLALGANLTSTVGTPIETLQAALQALSERGAVIRRVSPFYSTPAFPAGNGPDYVNAAAKISAEWPAKETLAVFHEIEAAMGRARVERWGRRTLDLDLIAYGDLVVPDRETYEEWRNLPIEAQMSQTPDKLILPHPRMQDRAFVLVPLADVAPDWVHPVLGQSVQELRNALDPAELKAVKSLQ